MSGDDDFHVALRAASAFSRRGARDGPSISDALTAARTSAVALIEAASVRAPAAPQPPAAAGDAMAAARAAAAAAAQKLSSDDGGGETSGSTPAAPSGDAAAAKRAAAAAAFAASLSNKKSRWGEGAGSSSALVAQTSESGSGAGAGSAAKSRQALVVSQLSDKLAAFRKDRGVEAPAEAAATLTLKLYVPEPEEGGWERNWVAIFIGKEGINKKRLEAQCPGARIFLRGEGTQLRNGPKPAEASGKGGKGKGKGGGKGGGGKGKGKGGGADDDAEAMHVLIEADSQDAMDAARVTVLAQLNPRQNSSALALFDEQQIISAALEKTTDSEECAFCGKPGHHHSKCPKRKSQFTMAGVKCAACGAGGHTARDCKGDRSKVASLTAQQASSHRPSAFEDVDFAAFESELMRR